MEVVDVQQEAQRLDTLLLTPSEDDDKTLIFGLMTQLSRLLVLVVPSDHKRFSSSS